MQYQEEELAKGCKFMSISSLINGKVRHNIIRITITKLLQQYVESGLGIINNRKVTRPLTMTRQSSQFLGQE
jgi:hypothetical protein